MVTLETRIHYSFKQQQKRKKILKARIVLINKIKLFKLVSITYYENTPMQYTELFKVVKNESFQWKTFDNFLIFAQNIDCGYKLEPPRRGSSNENPQSMFWIKK